LIFSIKNITCSAIIIGIFTIFMPRIALSDNTANNAVVLMYQYIDNPADADNSITLPEFENHIRELKKAHYNIMPLSVITESLKAGKPLPEKTVSIAFNDAYKDTLNKAIPILEDNNVPYTIFFPSDLVTKDNPSRLTSDDLHNILNDGYAELGILPSDDESLIDKDKNEVAKVMNKAVSFYENLVGKRPSLFMYADGEYSKDIKAQIASYKFLGEFTENSGAIGTKSDFNALPSFVMTKDYGDIDRFINSTKATPLVVSDIVPEDSLINTDKPDAIGFSVEKNIENPEDISCYASDVGKLDTTVIGENRIEIRLKKPLIYRKTSINCTLLVRNSDSRDAPWKSYSMLLIKKGE